MNEEIINNKEKIVSLSNGTYDAMKNLATRLGLCANYDDLLYIREYYRKVGYYPTENELYMLDAILKKRKSSPIGYAFSKLKITDEVTASSYINIISDINRQNPKRRPIPPSYAELMHVKTGSEETSVLEDITCTSVFQNDGALTIKAQNGSLLFSIGRRSDAKRSSDYVSGSAFVMLEPSCEMTDAEYLSAAHALCSDQELSGIIIGVEKIGSFGILTSLASVCEGVYIDPSRLSDFSLPFSPATFAVSYEGRILIVTKKENIEQLSVAATNHGLSAIYFAKATSPGNLTVNRDIEGSFSLSCRFIKDISYTPEYSEAIVGVEDTSLGCAPEPIIFESNDSEPACSDSQNVRRYDGRIVSCTLALCADRPYTKAMCVVNNAIESLVSCGVYKKNITVSVRYGYTAENTEQSRGAMFAMLLGAYEARKKASVSECASALLPSEDIPFVACIAYANVSSTDNGN